MTTDDANSFSLKKAVMAKVTASAPPPAKLTFPASLIQPPKSQVLQYEDGVTAKVEKLDSYAQRMGSGFGIPMTTFSLDDNDDELDQASKSSGWDIAFAILMRMSRPMEFVSLEKKDGRWGLFYCKRQSFMVNTGQKSFIVPLRDAPLDARERFLLVSEDFFRKYLTLCQDRLGSMKKAVTAADKTLSLLEELSFE